MSPAEPRVVEVEADSCHGCPFCADLEHDDAYNCFMCLAATEEDLVGFPGFDRQIPRPDWCPIRGAGVLVRLRGP